MLLEHIHFIYLALLLVIGHIVSLHSTTLSLKFGITQMAKTFISIKCLNCTCMSGPFQKLTAEELELIDKNRTEISYRKGETMCKQGSFISNMMFIRKGLAKIYLEDGQRPVMLSLAGQGSFIGLPSLFGAGIYHYTVEALEDTEVCLVDIHTFRKMLKSNAEFTTAVLEKVNGELVETFNRLHFATNKQINSRFAELLLHLSKHIFKNNPFKNSLARKDMADMIYSSQESISRLIKEFKSKGLIDTKGNTIEILDEVELSKISESE